MEILERLSLYINTLLLYLALLWVVPSVAGSVKVQLVS
jgi:hypothetical protein